MDNIYFSVVIPLYNKEKHIKRAIDSVLNQSHQNFEIIVVDDGSTDDGATKVKEYNDDRVKLIQQDNQGVSVARNRGIKEAKYELIGFLDADDEWKNDFLKEIVELRKNHLDMGAYATAYEFYKDDNSIKRAKYSNLQEGFKGKVDNYFKYTLKNSLISASSVVISRKIFDEVGYFDINLTHGEDLDMWFRIVLNYNIAFSDKVLAVYHQDASNRACDREHLLEFNFTNKLVNNIKKYRLDDNIFNNIYINNKLIDRVENYILYKKGESARKILPYITNKRKYLYYVISYFPVSFIIFLLKIKRKLKNKY
ncbi:glycosyltransferase family 2 protein [Halanaerobaculum tunisiense]